MKKTLFAAAAASLMLADFGLAPIFAQDLYSENIIVTGSRRSDADFYSEEKTVIGLKRRADYAAQPVWIVSDSRDEDVRRQEVYAMLKAAIDRAKGAGVELVYGDFELKPITLANYRDLVPRRAGRNDTSQISFFVQKRLNSSTADVDKTISDFIKSVPATGRSLMEKRGNLNLTIVGPDQYRDQIVKLIAAESKKYAGYFGSGYGVEISGLDKALIWTQVSASEVFLYLPYRFTVRN